MFQERLQETSQMLSSIVRRWARISTNTLLTDTLNSTMILEIFYSHSCSILWVVPCNLNQYLIPYKMICKTSTTLILLINMVVSSESCLISSLLLDLLSIHTNKFSWNKFHKVKLPKPNKLLIQISNSNKPLVNIGKIIKRKLIYLLNT